jgi:hypothetical protein
MQNPIGANLANEEDKNNEGEEATMSLQHHCSMRILKEIHSNGEEALLSIRLKEKSVHSF